MRRLAALILLAAAGVTACTRPERAGPPPPSPSVGPPAVLARREVYAFEDAGADINVGRVYLVRDGKVVAGMPGRDPALTESGRFLVTSDEEKVFVMDTGTGRWQKHRLPFLPPCPAPWGLTGDALLLVAPTMQRRALPELRVPESIAAVLPPRRPGCVLAAVHGEPIVLVSNRAGAQLYRVGADGAARQLGQDPFWSATDEVDLGVIRFSIAGPPRMAYVVTDYSSGENITTIRVLDLDTGLETVPATAAWREFGSPDDLGVLDMWWSSTGVLHATVHNSEYAKKPGRPDQRLFRVLGDAWQPTSMIAWQRVRELSGGRWLVVAPMPGDRPTRLYERARRGSA